MLLSRGREASKSSQMNTVTETRREYHLNTFFHVSGAVVMITVLREGVLCGMRNFQNVYFAERKFAVVVEICHSFMFRISELCRVTF